MTRYTAQVSREGRWWVAEVRELSAATQARGLGDLRVRVADMIATTIGCEPEDLDVDLQLTLPAEVSADLERAHALREQAASAQHESAVAVRSAAGRLRANGVTVRDIGAALGVSYQRAHQLLNDRVI